MSDAKDLMIEMKAEFKRQSRSGKSSTLKWVRANPAEMRPKHLVNILKQDWDSLKRQAELELKARDSALAAMMPKQKRIADIATKSKLLEGLLISQWIPPSKREDWPEIRDKVAEELKKKELSPEQIKHGLTNLENLKPKNISKTINDSLSSSARYLDFLAERNLSCFMGAMLSLTVSRFNNAADLESSLNLPTEELIAGLMADLLAKEQKIWQALKNEDLKMSAEAAQDLDEWASVLVGEIAKYAAAIAKKRELTPRNQDDCSLALQIGDLIRGLLLGIALGKRVAWLTGWGVLLNPTLQWLNAAEHLDFMPAYKPPSEVSIATLAADPTRFDGKEVLVYGVLEPVTIVHRANKAVSSAPISDPDGKSILLVLPYIKLDSGGMVQGAYARVSGIWKAKSKEINGPALHIDRRNLGEESKTSWLAWAEMSMRYVIEVVPHQLAAGWSWQTGPGGAGNSLRYGTWFVKKKVI